MRRRGRLKREERERRPPGLRQGRERGGEELGRVRDGYRGDGEVWEALGDPHFFRLSLPPSSASSPFSYAVLSSLHPLHLDCNLWAVARIG